MSDMPEKTIRHEHEESHGHSVAAWTAVVIILVASAIMSLAVVFPSVTWFVVGAVVAVVGVAAGKILAMAGYGESKPDSEEARQRRTQEHGGVH